MHVEDVPGPNGETSHLITCHDSADCYQKAAEICPGGYVIRTNATRSGRASSSTELLVSCNADLPPGAAEQAGADAPREDVRVCEASYKYETDFADYWAARTPGAKRLEELPEARDFVAVCKGMPERVQRCLHEHYREAHDKACDAVLSRLEPAERSKVDGLFLEAPKAAAPAETMPAAQPAVVPVDAGK